MIRPLLRWWLVLFIEARVLSPNIRREAIPQRPILRGEASTSYPDKRWSSPAKGSSGDAVLGSMVTAVLLVLVFLHRYGNLCLMPRDSSPALASLAPKRK